MADASLVSTVFISLGFIYFAEFFPSLVSSYTQIKFSVKNISINTGFKQDAVSN